MIKAMEIEIDNLKCGGCEKSIVKGVSSIDGVSEVKVDHDQQLVQFLGEENLRQKVADKLRSMGYPETGLIHGLEAGVANVKSFVSCAIGRVS